MARMMSICSRPKLIRSSRTAQPQVCEARLATVYLRLKPNASWRARVRSSGGPYSLRAKERTSMSRKRDVKIGPSTFGWLVAARQKHVTVLAPEYHPFSCNSMAYDLIREWILDPARGRRNEYPVSSRRGVLGMRACLENSSCTWLPLP